MCGIVGTIGRVSSTVQITLKRLAQLEYRGYDSYGIASIQDSGISVHKQVGSIGAAMKRGEFEALPESRIALAHTRWATHGGVTQKNAHPHVSFDGRIALVHNGVIENYATLRSELMAQGIRFLSETDTEVLAHLIAQNIASGMSTLDAISATISRAIGEYALGIVRLDEPGYLYGAKRRSPLLVCASDDESVIASDQSALLGMSADIIYLEDGDVVRVSVGSCEVFAGEGALKPVERPRVKLKRQISVISRGTYDHFMIKEINDIPEVATTALAIPAEQLREALPKEKTDRMIMVGAGSAYYVSAIGSYLFSKFAGMSVPSYASDEAGYLTHFGPHDTVVAVSQSGETFDTLEVCRSAVAKGAKLTSISNVPDSTQERMAHNRIQQGCGVEVCVLSTKSIISQVLIVARMALETGKQNGHLSEARYAELEASLARVPQTLRTVISECSGVIRTLAEKYCKQEHWFFVGRGMLYPVGLESALKFKEVSYHHAEGIAAGFFKHGTISLIKEDFYTVALYPSPKADHERYLATLANVSEIVARKGPVLGFGPRGLPVQDVQNCVDYVGLPFHDDDLADVLVLLVAGQLFAYYCALTLGREIDQPRSLAKSVTVR